MEVKPQVVGWQDAGPGHVLESEVALVLVNRWEYGASDVLHALRLVGAIAPYKVPALARLLWSLGPMVASILKGATLATGDQPMAGFRNLSRAIALGDEIWKI